MKSKSFQPIKVTLTFDKNDIQAILRTANFGDGKQLKAGELTKVQYNDLKKELQDSAGGFVSEILDGAPWRFATAWLSDFTRKHIDKD